MGLDAEIIAVGPFSQRIVNVLEYPPEFYRNVSEGETIITLVFEALTSEQSHALASSFGVEAMELGRHVLNPAAANIGTLRHAADEQNVTAFLVLRDAGFKFYYRPKA